MKKKILIPYATYGNGHKVVANYIKNNFSKQNPDLIIETIDILDYTSSFMKKVSKGLFEKTMFAKNPVIWELIYRFYNHRLRSIGMKNLCYKIFDKEKLRNKIKEFNPDIIISTHFFASMLTSKYVKNNLIKAKIYTIITDYELHEFWLKSKEYEEAIIVSTKEMKKELIQKGYPSKKIKVFGIPLSDEFSQNADSEVYKRKLKLVNDKKTVLFFGGGNNSAVSLPFFKKLLEEDYDFNIIFIAGKNNELKRKALELVNNYQNSKVTVLGYVDKIFDYLSAADLVITKPGGLTVSECLHLRKPMILINRSAGQEKGNYKYLVSKKYALKAGNPRKFSKYLKEINNNPDILNNMQNNMQKENKNKAIADLYNLVIK